jgi:cellulose synthase/poly-beta-1,6-N-acetylglucosamine synthase-like glycosyltransferase
MIADLAILLGTLYASGMVLLAFAVARRHRQVLHGPDPSVSVIIAARNEEKNLRKCLTSVAALRYPHERLEVIVVDDFSTDQTREIIDDFAGKFPYIRGVRSEEPTAGLRGKVNALATGIGHSAGEILMFTDADCEVGPDWVSRTLSYYSDESVAIVAGFASIRETGLFSRIQALDWMMLLSAASAAASIGFPVTAVGNNLSITRSTYDRTGGFRKIRFNVTEDLALFQSAISLAGTRAVIPLDPGTMVTSEPCTSWSQLFAQRKRWFVGGREMRAGRIAVFAVAWLFQVVLAAGIFFLDPILWSGLFLLKIGADLLLVLPSLRSARRLRLLTAWLPFQVYFVCYVLVMPLIVLINPAVVWKERRFGETKKPSRDGRASS